MGKEIEKTLRDDLGLPGKLRKAAIPLHPLLRHLEGELARKITACEFKMPQPVEAVQRSREGFAGRRLVENRSFSHFQGLPGEAEAAAHEGVGVIQPPCPRIIWVKMDTVRHRAAEGLPVQPAAAQPNGQGPERAPQSHTRRVRPQHGS